MSFNIIQCDITRIYVDAIVNAANTNLKMGGGVCGSIFRAAGCSELSEACDKIAPISTGKAAITPAFNLKNCKYIIHAAYPVYRTYTPEESERLLYSAYVEAMKLAEENGCRSIAFPLISNGIYGYPREEALKVAIAAIKDYTQYSELMVFLAINFVVDNALITEIEGYVCGNYYNDDISSGSYRMPSVASIQPVQSEIAPNYDDFLSYSYTMPSMASRQPIQSEIPPEPSDEEFCKCEVIADEYPRDRIQERRIYHSKDGIFRNIISDHDGDFELDESFSDTLLKLIDAKGKTDVEVYKKANIDRKLFSKIRTGKGYMPSKRTVIALAIALELDLEETEKLLKKAGYALSHSIKSDVIIEYFIVNGKYDIFEINEVLFSYDQSLLGM